MFYVCVLLCVGSKEMTLPRGGESQEGNNVRQWHQCDIQTHTVGNQTQMHVATASGAMKKQSITTIEICRFMLHVLCVFSKRCLSRNATGYAQTRQLE